MLSKKLWLGILVMVLVFGITIYACVQSDGGTFTFTNIPSKYNGTYAYFYDSSNLLIGAKSVEIDIPEDFQGATIHFLLGFGLIEPKVFAARISNGKVSLPIWKVLDDGEVVRYSGNNTIDEIEILIGFTESEGLLSDFYKDNSTTIEFKSVEFSNGKVIKSYHDGKIYNYITK